MASPTSLLGVGLYTTSEVARLLCVPRQKLSRWADGYTFRHGDAQRRAAPVIRRELEEAGHRRILTFADMIELKFVAMFRGEGVSLPYIRAAAAEAARLFDTDHPFAVRQFRTDGRRIFATIEDDPPPGIPPSRFTQELVASQGVFTKFVEPFFRDLEIEGDDVSRWWPLGQDKGVVIDPRRRFGKPILAESGVPTLALYEASRGDLTVQEVADWYGLPPDAVRLAIEYERSLVTAA